jgi:hypothetical protein
MADWFAPKRFGIGVRKPINRQGRLLTVAYLLLIVASALLVRKSLLALFAVLVPATAAFLILSARTTRGGWRWRWGKATSPPTDHAVD